MAYLQHWRHRWRTLLTLKLLLLFSCCCIVVAMILSQGVVSSSLSTYDNIVLEKKVTVVHDHLSVCSLLQEKQSKHKDKDSSTNLHFEMGNTEDLCNSQSMGNVLGRIYMTELVAKLAGATFHFSCNQSNITFPDSVQYMFPNHRSEFSINDTLSWKDVCDSCTTPFPHTCPYGLQFTIPTIQNDLRHAAQTWLELHPQEELDDAVIHLRCGDVLSAEMGRLLGMKYGFSPYSIYSVVSPQVQRIGILTSSLDAKHCRQGDCSQLDYSKELVLDLQHYLREHWKNATVTIRSEETPVASSARMVLSKQVICDSSTFCLFPSIATTGTSYITGNEQLYPWANVVGMKEENIHVIPRHAKFVSIGDMARNGWTAAEVVALRRGADKESLQKNLQ